MEVLVNEIEPGAKQVVAKSAALGGAFPMKISSKANPSYVLQVVPAPNVNLNFTEGLPARLSMVCDAVRQPEIPLPPVQLPLEDFTVPDHPFLILC